MDGSKTIHEFADGTILAGEVRIKAPADVAQRVLDLMTRFLQDYEDRQEAS